MNLRSIDLNLLVIFDALMTERSITRAARKVGITPSAMSHALQRLRQRWAPGLQAATLVDQPLSGGDAARSPRRQPKNDPGPLPVPVASDRVERRRADDRRQAGPRRPVAPGGRYDLKSGRGHPDI